MRGKGFIFGFCLLDSLPKGYNLILFKNGRNFGFFSKLREREINHLLENFNKKFYFKKVIYKEAFMFYKISFFMVFISCSFLYPSLPDFLPAGRVGVLYEYDFQISSGRIEAKDLPSFFNRDYLSAGKLYGTPDRSGIYYFEIDLKDMEGRLLESKGYTYGVLSPGQYFYVFPNSGSVAGGTYVHLFANEPIFKGTEEVIFTVDSNCLYGLAAQIIDKTSPYHILLKTPSFPEVLSSIFIDKEEGIQDICQSNSYNFYALAFTSNQVTKDISVINTKYDELFDTNQNTPEIDGIELGEVIPLGSAILHNIGNGSGRYLFQVDGYRGDLLWIDSSNFEVMDTIKLQSDSPECKPLWTWGAYDIDNLGRFALVAHISSGIADGYGDPWNPNGGVSIVDLNLKKVLDADDDPTTTSECAPDAGISRVEAPLWLQPFAPMSVRILAKLKEPYLDGQYHNGEKFPGVFGLISGVGPTYKVDLPPFPCRPGMPCDYPDFPEYTKRPVSLLVLDMNENIYHKDYFCHGPNQFPPPNSFCEILCGEDYSNCHGSKQVDKSVCGCEDPEAVCDLVSCLSPNPDYKKIVQYFPLGVDGVKIKLSNSGMDYVIRDGGYLKASVYSYVLNSSENTAYVVKWDDWTDTFCMIAEDGNCYVNDETSPILKIPTGNNPTDVKVQKVPNIGTYAYITNAGDDSVSIIDTATNTELPPQYSPINQDQCLDLDHYPTSFDTRSVGNKGYSSDFYSNTVSVFDLPMSQMNKPICQINVGGAPIRIAVQPHTLKENVSYQIKNDIAMADLEAFTEPSKKTILIKDWERIEELQETQANPQAVLSNINNFQKNMNKWVVNVELKKEINENVDLYRANYIVENPRGRQ